MYGAGDHENHWSIGFIDSNDLVVERTEMDNPKSRTEVVLDSAMAWLLAAVVGGLVNVGFELFKTLWPRLNSFVHVWWLTLLGTGTISDRACIFTFKKRYQRPMG